MPLAVFCDNPECKTVFLINNVSASSPDKPGVMSMPDDAKYSPCKRCGGECTIPAGVYEFDYADNKSNKVARLVAGPQKSKDLVNQAEMLIAALKHGKPSKETIIQAVAQVSPVIADISRKTASTTNYKEWAGLIMALLGLLISIQQGYFKKDEKSDIEREYIDHLLKENSELRKAEATYQQKPKSASGKVPAKKEVKQEPNEKCACGSGKKYKKCHGFTNTPIR